jgi:alkylmercury lyase
MTPNDITTANDLWEAACCHFPVVSHEEQRAGLVLLRELARGEPVAMAQLARALAKPAEAAEAFVTDSALSPFVHKDEGGRIQGFYGLSVTPTHHQLTINGSRLWAWCAPDTLLYPELLRATAVVETRDPETGELVRLTVSPDQIEAMEPTEVVSSIRRPEAWDATSAARIMATACHFNFFFASRESGERWVEKQPETILQSLDAVYAFIKRVNAHLFGAELARLQADAA